MDPGLRGQGWPDSVLFWRQLSLVADSLLFKCWGILWAGYQTNGYFKLMMMKVFIARKEVGKCYKVMSPLHPCPSWFTRTPVAKDHIQWWSAGVSTGCLMEAVQSVRPRTKPWWMPWIRQKKDTSLPLQLYYHCLGLSQYCFISGLFK